MARGPVVLCELSGQGLEQVGVLAAMSGSPVYIGERLLGAVAYTWPFAKKPLCGVTPTEDLLEVLDGGGARGPAPAGGTPATLHALFGETGAAPNPARPRWEPCWKALEAAGFMWSGGEDPAAPPPREAAVLAPGGMIAAQLISGDLTYAAYGTLAIVDGERFVAFGHPFMSLGPVELPVAAARVDGLMPSLEKSFKFCSSGEEVGTLLLDAASGVSGRFGRRADTLPVTFRSRRGGASRELHFRLARHPALTPALLQAALGQLQGQLEGVADPKTVTLRLTFLLPAGRRLELNPFTFSGPTPFVALNDFASATLDLLLNNPREAVPVDGLELTVDTLPGLTGGALPSAWPEASPVLRGEPVTLRATFEPYRGTAETFSIRLETSSWPVGEIQLWVGDAFSLFRKLDGTEAVQPRRPEELLAFLKELPSNDRVLVAAVAPTTGTRLLAGRRLDDPPPSLGALLGKELPATASPPPAFRLLSVTEGPRTGAFEGLLTLTLPVRPTRPSR